MKRKAGLCIVLFITMLVMMTGCGKKSTEDSENKTKEVAVNKQELTLTLDEAGNYTGMDSISDDYTKDQAVSDGCYVWENYEVYGGQDIWDEFVEDSKAGTDSSIRVAVYMGDDVYYSDVLYADEKYHMFISTDEEKPDNKTFDYLLELEGSMSSSDDSSNTKFAILTDDEELSFDDVLSTMLDSDTETEDEDQISPYLMIWMD